MSHRILKDLAEAFMKGGPGQTVLSATADGAKIPDDRLLQIVIPTWGNANNILILPAAKPGTIVILAGAATGGELRTHDPANVAINGGSGANAESAVAANRMIVAICESPTSWKAFGIAANGLVSGLESAAA